jgi:hypothetical protein
MLLLFSFMNVFLLNIVYYCVKSAKKAIPCPVKQCVSGARGSYSLTLLETSATSLKLFQARAHSNAEKKLPQELRNSTVFHSYYHQCNDISSSSSLSSSSSSTAQVADGDDEDAEEEELSTQQLLELRVRRFWKTIGPNMEPPVYGADALGSLFKGKRCVWGCLCKTLLYFKSIRRMRRWAHNLFTFHPFPSYVNIIYVFYVFIKR